MKSTNIIYILLTIIIIASCAKNKKGDLYDFLAICNNEFYLDFGVNLEDTLIEFEYFLIQEGHLYSNEGKSYKTLLRKLKDETYFSPPLKKDNFSNELLYKNPKELTKCVEETFKVDTLDLTKLPFYILSKEIATTISSKEELAIQELFNIYLKLPEEEIRFSFVKENLLLLFYRWYFKSKYDRSIPLNDVHKTHDTLQ